MPLPPLLSYSDVTDRSQGMKKHLLLGNGFSIACRQDLFKYDSIFERSDFSGMPRARKAFDALSTTNFELVMRALRNFSLLANIYAPGNTASKQAAIEDAQALREVLVHAIADCHPSRPHDIKREEYAKCRNFLRGYDSINTLNYDLLLYWTLMQDDLGDADVPSDDGFRKPADDPTADYVSWDSANSKGQTIRYLHGALHLYDTGTEMKKFTWVDTQVPLIEQIRAALSKDFYPVFISEGTSKEKVDRIRHNDYLCKMRRSFTEIQGALVVFGHSLNQCDDHIFRDWIGRQGKTNRLFISLFGSPDSAANKEIIRRGLSLSELRKGKKSLEVNFFDVSTVSVWS